MKKIKNNVLLIFVILIIIVLIFIVSIFFLLYNKFENSGRIAKGISIKGVDVSRNDERRSKKCCDKLFR